MWLGSNPTEGNILLLDFFSWFCRIYKIYLQLREIPIVYSLENIPNSENKTGVVYVCNNNKKNGMQQIY